MREIDLIVVHHTVTPLDRSFDSIRRDHIENRGWSDIGYHYVINPDGKLYLGRPVGRIGAHVRGKNSKSVGVSVIGNYESDTLTQATRTQLYQLLNDLRRQYPNAQVVGHRDVAATLCPGKHLYGWLGTIC